MDTIAFQSMARKILSVALSFAMLNFPVSAKDPDLGGVDVKLDELSFRKVMTVKIGSITSGLSPWMKTTSASAPRCWWRKLRPIKTVIRPPSSIC